MKITHTVKSETYSPEDAEFVLVSKNYAGQRTIRSRHVNYLANEIVSGSFRNGTAIAFCETPDGRLHLVNGQHTLSAIVKAGVSVELDVEKYLCKSMADVAAIFATYDRQMTRTQPDIYHAYGLAGRLGLTRTQAGLLTTATQYLVQDVSKIITDRKPSPQEIMKFAEKIAWRFSRFLDATQETPQSCGKLRSSVVALAIITANHPRHDDFWRGFASDDGLRYFDPRKQFLEFNKSTKLSGAAPGKKSSSPLQTFKTGAYCWNRYIGGLQLKSLQIDKCAAVVTIDGTPYSGGFGTDSFQKLMVEQSR